MITVLTNVLQRRALQQSQLQFPHRHHPCRGRRQRALCLIVSRRRCRPRRCRSSSPTPRPTPARSTWPRAARAPSSHIFGELLKIMAGIDIVHVPYRSNYVPDLITGQVHMLVAPMPQGIELVRSGKSARARRDHGASARGCRTFRPSPSSCRATRRSAGTASACPRTRRPRSSTGSTRRPTRRSPIPKLKARLAGLGVEPMPMTPAEFTTFIGQRERQVDQGDQDRRRHAGLTIAAPSAAPPPAHWPPAAAVAAAPPPRAAR